MIAAANHLDNGIALGLAGSALLYLIFVLIFPERF